MKTLFSNFKKDFTPFVALLMGAPGVGKGTQYDFISTMLKFIGFKVLYVATGDFCRAIVKNDQHPLHVEFVEKNKAAAEAGKLVDDEMIFKILRHELKLLNISQYHFIFLDGVIRTANQMTGVFKILKEFDERLKFNLTLDFNATKETCVERAENRRQEAIKANKEPRKDDEKEAIEVRHEEYQASSIAVRPIAEMVGSYKLIGAQGKPQETYSIVLEAFNEILPQYFSPKLK
jgi:adenylate kinase family enzyme